MNFEINYDYLIISKRVSNCNQRKPETIYILLIHTNCDVKSNLTILLLNSEQIISIIMRNMVLLQKAPICLNLLNELH